ncbi:alpha/beta-hydrolase [Stipitochalara longipes BDJ]|nr:alpha/beta-hydrolase [Stipitochalara longipes BDJ]
MSKPTIVLVPGAWHSPESYSEVVAILSKHGYPAMNIPLSSVGANPPHEDFTGDVAGIRSCLTKLVSEEKEIVLVVHSYTGLPGQQAAEGLSKNEQAKNGLKGGVVRYVVINGMIIPEGYQAVAEGDYSKFPKWMDFDIPNKIVTVSPENAKKVFYNDMSEAKGDELAGQLKHQSMGVYFSIPTYAAWKEIPSTFLQGDLDESSVSGEMLQMMLAGARQIEPSAFDVVEHCEDGGHCLMISKPEWTADALRRAAGEKF